MYYKVLIVTGTPFISKDKNGWGFRNRKAPEWLSVSLRNGLNTVPVSLRNEKAASR
jgi:hypothetical protein